MTRIAVLGWGSLLWDLDDLAPKVAGDWRMRGGPELPMEFSRVSPKRKMGLVVCLDPVHGSPCPTHAIASTRRSVAVAVADLAERERTPVQRIGHVDTGGGRHGRMAAMVDAVGEWCATAGWDGAVWTDLEPNFADHTGREFTIARGIAYLRTLAGGSLAEAHRYISQAPDTTRTPLREALESDAWWQGVRRR